MLGQILTCIIQNYDKQDDLTARLKQENEAFQQEIENIQHKFHEVPIHEIHTFLEKHDLKSRAIPKPDKIDQINSLLTEFYEVCGKEEQTNQKCEYLIEEIGNILDLVERFNLLAHLDDANSEYTEESAKELKQLIAHLSQEILSCLNLQNRNKFQVEPDEVCQQYQYTIQFLQKYRQAAVQIYQKKVESSYHINENFILISLSTYISIWKEEAHFSEVFMRAIEQFFSRFIAYEVNNKQYKIIVYKFKKDDSSLEIKKHSSIIFDNTDVCLHFEVLIDSLRELQNFFNQLEQITPHQYLSTVLELRKNIIGKTKEYLEYLIPYLKINMRKSLTSILTSKQQSSSVTIYELLVNMKLPGQDADSLVDTINQMVRKVRQDSRTLPIIMKFIHMAKDNKKLFNMLFFLCDQLVDQFEDMEQLTSELVQTIKELLNIREQIRFKIHQPLHTS